MSRRSMVRVVLATAGLMLAFGAGATRPEDAISVDPTSLQAAGCFGLSACTVNGADVSTVGGTIAKKKLNGATGFGVNGGAAGGEIDIGESLVVDFGGSRSVLAIKILFLYNGPEFDDRAEKAKILADGIEYTLAVRSSPNNAAADWSGSGTVTKCGGTSATGSGCFLITNPFPATVSQLEFQASPGGAPFGGGGSSESDYGIGFIDVAAQAALDLVDCSGTEVCNVATVDGNVAFSLTSMQVSNPGGSTEALVFQVQLPDCRYVPHVCLDLLPPAGDVAASDDAARAMLIDLGVIRTLDPSGPNRLNPAAQMLNVTPLLPPEITSLFDGSGTPPDGLPPLYVASRWRGQAVNDFRFDSFFFKTDSGIEFSDVFDGLIDVSVLTGDELGCVADTGNLLAWDVITTVSELARTTGGRHVDTPINVGCVNPTKVKGTRLSLYAINLEVVPNTWGPTIKSFHAKVTANNDAVFARMVQSLWKDIGETRASYACKQADPTPSGGTAPLSSAQCKALSSLWSHADLKVNLCVLSSFGPVTGYALGICEYARELVDDFEAALPATASGPDPYNRLGELKARVEVFRHVWDERFLKSIKPGGFCREWGSCPP